MRAEAQQRWLWGPSSDLLLGCGLAYAAVFVALLLFGHELELLIPLGLLPLGSLLLGTPHYGATILRAYERREDRQRYWVFTVYATALIFALFLGGLHAPLLGSLTYTVYLTWSPWHYAGQNFGLATMFLRRRGVEVPPSARRALHGSFVLSFVLAIVGIHDTVAAGSTYAPRGDPLNGYEFIPIGLPPLVSSWVIAIALVGYVACVVWAAVLLKRRGSWADLAPAGALVGSQALWFLVPAVLRGTEFGRDLVPLAIGHAEYAAWWIVFAHSAQYLWVTSYYATVETGARPTGYLTRAFLAGSALWGVPSLVFATAGFGPLAYDQGLLVLIASCVNLHHFVLDGAIWKLRDGKVARILLRGSGGSDEGDEGAETSSQRPSAAWPRVVVWTLGAICAVQFVAYTLEQEFGVRRATERGDVARLEKATHNLALIGLETPNAALNQGILYAQHDRLREARSALKESLAVHPTAVAYTAMGQVQARQGNLSESVTSLEAALAIDPLNATALHQMGANLLELGRPDEALQALLRARSTPAGQLQAEDLDRLIEHARREAGKKG